MSHPRRRIVPLVMLTGAATTVPLLALPAAADPATSPQADTVTVDVLGITDFHGRLTAGGSVAGAAVMAGAVNHYRSQNPDTVFIGAGDMIGGSTFVSAIQQDQPTLDVLSMMDIEAITLGNHELDAGAADFTERVVPASTFPWLAGNITGLDGVQPYHVWTAPDSGVRVAFIGAITESLPTLVSPSGIEGVAVHSMTDAVLRTAGQLSDGDETNDEADIIVVVAHDGPGSTDVSGVTSGRYGDFVTALREHGAIDAVMGGHTHIAYAHDLDGFFATQAGQYSQHMTRLSFAFDPATGEVVTGASSAETFALAPGGEPAYPVDAQVQAVVDEAVEAASEIGAQPVGRISADILRGGGESPLSNLIADVQLDATAELGADVALMNPGGVREDLIFAGDGVVTYEDVAVVQPFANTLVTVAMTGEQLKAALEQQWRVDGTLIRLGASRTLTYTFDETRPVGERIVDLRVRGDLVQPQDSYVVTTNSFIASGGDGFSVFAGIEDKADSGRVDLQAMVEYFSNADVVRPPADQRAVGVSLSGDLVPGGELTLDVSSMLFASSPQLGGDTLEVRLSGQSLGTAGLDAEPHGDATGRAQVTVALPEDIAPGSHTLTLTDGVSTVYRVIALEAGQQSEELPWLLTSSLEGDPRTQVVPMLFGPSRVDEVFVGDWDGDGIDTPAYRIGNTLHLRNSLTTGAADTVITFGRAGDSYLVGDLTGEGRDTFAVRRGSEVHLDLTGDGGWAERHFSYGRTSDDVVLGDWNGDGLDTPAVRRGNAYLIRNTLDAGHATFGFTYGRGDDAVLVGDWNGDGGDTVAVRRGDHVLLRNDLRGGAAESVTRFAQPEDVVLAGSFGPQGSDTLGIVGGGSRHLSGPER